MSVVKDLNELHFTIKTFVIGLIITMPFWYLDIYLFAPWFTKANPIHIPIIVAFCLSIGWLLLCVVFLDIFQYTEKPEVEKNEKPFEDEFEDFWLKVIILSIIFLGLFSFIWYVVNGRFFYLVLTSFGLIGFLIAFGSLGLYGRKMEKKK